MTFQADVVIWLSTKNVVGRIVLTVREKILANQVLDNTNSDYVAYSGVTVFAAQRPQLLMLERAFPVEELHFNQLELRNAWLVTRMAKPPRLSKKKLGLGLGLVV